MLPKGYKIRFEGSRRAIAFDEAQWEVMNEILPETRIKMRATMQAYCDLGPENLPPQRFKFEIQYEEAGKKTRIEAFKGRHVRFYGACGSLGGRPVFLVTGSDSSKKTDAADQKKLKSAGKIAHDLFHDSSASKQIRPKSQRK